MPELTPTDLAAVLADLLRIKAYCAAATVGRWVVWTGCSWRRIGVVGTQDTVIEPTNHPIDHHPDLLARHEDLAFVVEARADLPRVIAALEQMVKERDALKAELEKWKLSYDDAYIADWKKQRGLM